MEKKEEKKKLRHDALRARRGMSLGQSLEACREITRRLLLLGRALDWRLISCYLDFDGEVGTGDFLEKSLAGGVRIAVPYVLPDTHRLYFSEIKDPSTELTLNQYGVKEPKRRYLRLLPIGALEAIILPGTVFDRRGNRLGYGLGFYDRALEQARGKVPLIGTAYHSQIVDSLPAEEHDIPVDLVITERENILPEGALKHRLTAALSEEVH